MVLFPEILSCPICGSQPDIGRCEPWPRDAGPQPFYATCYQSGDNEHCIGVNGDTRLDTIRNWNATVIAQPWL